MHLGYLVQAWGLGHTLGQLHEPLWVGSWLVSWFKAAQVAAVSSHAEKPWARLTAHSRLSVSTRGAMSGFPTYLFLYDSNFYQKSEQERERKMLQEQCCKVNLRLGKGSWGLSFSCIMQSLHALTSPEEAQYSLSDTDKHVFLKSLPEPELTALGTLGITLRHSWK